MTERGRIVQRAVPHMYTAPSGAILVVQNVPAEVYEDDDGDEVMYSAVVAERLDELIKALLLTAKPGVVSAISFDDEPSLPSVDYEIKFNGVDAKFSGASIQTWRLLMDKTYNAIKTALRASTNQYDGKVRAALFPKIVFLPPSSISLGIRLRDMNKLIAMNDDGDGAEKAFQLLMNASHWLDDANRAQNSLSIDDAALETVLRAVEELSPTTDEINTVSVKRIETSSIATFSKTTRAAARREIVKIRLRSSEGSREIRFSGYIEKLDEKGKVHLRDVAGGTELGTRNTLTCTFSTELLSRLLENFGKRIIAVAVQRRATRDWDKRPEIVDLERCNARPEDPANLTM